MVAAIQGSKEWLAQRIGKITGTSCSALEGFHPYSTPQDIVRRTVRDLCGASNEFKTTPAVEHGSAMEDTARVWTEKEFCITINETDFVTHPDYDFLGASPDGLIGLDTGAEFKCPYPRYTKTPYSVFDDKKKMYLWQCYLVMEVCDLDRMLFVCYLAANKTSKPDVHHDWVERPDNWLQEQVKGSLLPVKRKGTLSRIDLYKEWHEYIHQLAADKTLSAPYLTDLDEPEAYQTVTDPELDKLATLLQEKQTLDTKLQVDLAALKKITTAHDALKNALADKYGSNITNGHIQIRVAKRKPAIDYRKAFEAVGGESLLLEKDQNLDHFQRTTNTRQVTVSFTE